MGPHKKNAILGALRDRPETVWLPWRDLVGWVGGRPDGVGRGVAGGRADTTSKDLGGLGLLEVEMQRRNLKTSGLSKMSRGEMGLW
jgi:hypothetical protein